MGLGYSSEGTDLPNGVAVGGGQEGISHENGTTRKERKGDETIVCFVGQQIRGNQHRQSGKKGEGKSKLPEVDHGKALCLKSGGK